MVFNLKIQQTEKIQWIKKYKCYVKTSDKENKRGQGPKTKKKQRSKKARDLEFSLCKCSFEVWRDNMFIDYMAVQSALGYKPLSLDPWYEKIKKDKHRLISYAVNIYWKEQQ